MEKFPTISADNDNRTQSEQLSEQLSRLIAQYRSLREGQSKKIDILTSYTDDAEKLSPAEKKFQSAGREAIHSALRKMGEISNDIRTAMDALLQADPDQFDQLERVLVDTTDIRLYLPSTFDLQGTYKDHAYRYVKKLLDTHAVIQQSISTSIARVLDQARFVDESFVHAVESLKKQIAERVSTVQDVNFIATQIQSRDPVTSRALLEQAAAAGCPDDYPEDAAKIELDLIDEIVKYARLITDSSANMLAHEECGAYDASKERIIATVRILDQYDESRATEWRTQLATIAIHVDG